MVGGFGEKNFNFRLFFNTNIVTGSNISEVSIVSIILKLEVLNKLEKSEVFNNDFRNSDDKLKVNKSLLGSYLAGLIEGDGSIYVPDTEKNIKNYYPRIIVTFKKADLPLAYYLQKLTNCGKIYIKSNEGYVL
jgi:hypothetical protein